MWDMVDNLKSIVLFVHYGVKAHIKLCQQWKNFDILHLPDLSDFVKRQIEEPESFNCFKSTELHNLVL